MWRIGIEDRYLPEKYATKELAEAAVRALQAKWGGPGWYNRNGVRTLTSTWFAVEAA